MKKIKIKNQKSFFKKHKLLPWLAVFIFISAILLSISFNHMLKTKAVIDSKKTEMKSIPPEIKKQIATASPSATFRVPILLYHYVEYVKDKRDTIRQSLNINPYVFEQQVKTLSDAGYTFMSAKELGDVLDGKLKIPDKPVLLTFDDGHWDFYTDILPILKKYKAKATAYIIPGFTGGSDFMTTQQVQEVADSGLVEIGAHTVHHISLKNKLLSVVQYEVNESKTMLENSYHIHVVSFAYPNGAFDVQSVKVVKDAGFETAVSTVPGIEQNQVNRYFLFRLRPGGRTGQSLLDWLSKSTFKHY